MASRKEYEMLFQLNAQLGSNFTGAFSKAQKEIAQMQEKIKALSKTQSDIAAYQKQQSAVEATRTKLEVLKQQYDNIQKEMKETEGYSSSLENKLLSKQQQIDKTSASLNNQTSKLNAMGESLRSAGVNTDNLTKESSELSTKMGELKQRQEEVASGAADFGHSTAEAFELVKSAVVTAGLAKAFKEIYDAAKECTDASIEFESAITGVFKTVDGTDTELAAIKQGIKDMSTEIPATTTEIAGVAEAAGQLGIATNDVLSFTRVMIDLGESTNLTSDEAASSLAKFANITGTSADNYSRLGSVIVDLGNNFATTEKDIVAMSTRLASAGTLSGFTEAEIMALATAMSSVGIEAEAGGTAMAQTLNAIETAVATKSETLKEFARLAGMSANEFANAWQNTPMVALQSFIAGLGNLKENGENTVVVLDELGLTGIRQSNMLKSLGLAAETMGNSIDTANKAWNENTALTIEASKRYATTESKIKMMQNSYNNLKVSIGDALVPEMKGLVGVSAEVMDGAADFVAQNPAVVKSVTAFVGVIGLATTGITAYATAAKVAKSIELASLFTTAGPIMLAVGAAAALTGGIIGIADAYEEAQIAARQYGDEVTAAAENYKTAMNTADELEKNISEWKSLNETISSGTASVDEVNAAKERLKENEQWLIDNYGIYMDNDGTISDEEIQSLELRNEELRETARLQAEIALYNAKEKYDDAKESVGNKQQKRDELSAETASLAKEQVILQKHLTSWQRTVNSDKFQNASAGEQNDMFNSAMGSLNSDLAAIGSDSYYSHFAGVETSIMSLTKEIEKNKEKINEYNTQLLEYSESAAEYKQAARDIIGLEISDIPTENLQEFAAVAKEIGEQAANAELQTAELERYAEQLTEIAHAAGLLPENQKIVFNADGALNVIEEVADGLDELDGKEVEIIANADTDQALVKINDVTYKVLKYDEATGIATLSADGKQAYGEIDLVTGELRKFDQDEAEAYLNANTDNFDTNIQNAKNQIASLDGKKITVTTVFKSVYQTVKSALGLGGYATGTENAIPGAHWVGEHGPELLWFDGGEKVLDAQRSASLAKSYENSANSYGTFQPRETLSATMSGATNQYKINISPQFTVQGGSGGDIESKFREFSDIVVDNVMDALEEAGIDAKRGAYA